MPVVKVIVGPLVLEGADVTTCCLISAYFTLIVGIKVVILGIQLNFVSARNLRPMLSSVGLVLTLNYGMLALVSANGTSV